MTVQCSELVRMSYPHADFSLDRTLGRYTMNPDAVALAANDGSFDVIELIISGQAATGDLRSEMNELLRLE